MNHEQAIRNLIARTIYEFYAPGELPLRTWREADIPTRQAVDEFIEKLKKLQAKEQ